MKKQFTFFVLIIIGVFSWTGNSYSGQFTFGDNSKYWGDPNSLSPTFANNWANVHNTSWNSIDESGSPKIANGQTDNSGSINNQGQLEWIEINFNYSTIGDNNIGDLFIDVGADLEWDYVVLGSDYEEGATSPRTHGTGSIYSFDQDSFPVTKNSDSVINYANYNIVDVSSWRQDHPWQYDTTIDSNKTAIGTYISGGDAVVDKTGINPSTVSTGQLIFKDLEAINLLDGVDIQPFIIAWTAFCANDVLMEKIPGVPGTVVPEPATMFLFGSGLIGLAGLSRRRSRKKK